MNDNFIGQNFSIEEIETMIQALTVWESEPTGSALLSGMFGVMLSKDREEASKNLEVEMGEANNKKRLRSEESILIKAKLIQLKQSIEANEAAEFLRIGGNNVNQR